MTIERIETSARMSKVVIHGDTVYLAGFTANKALAGGVVEQTAEILSIIDGYLAKAGTDKTKLLRATIWLSDIRTVDVCGRERRRGDEGSQNFALPHPEDGR